MGIFTSIPGSDASTPAAGLPGDPAGSPCRSLTYQIHNGGWVLTGDWDYLIDCDGPTHLTVPKGFRCDLASIPRILTALLPREKLGVSGPVLHDAIYRGTVGRGPDINITRRHADRLFWTLMRCDGVNRPLARTAWAAVRVFGWLAWKRLPDREWALRVAE